MSAISSVIDTKPKVVRGKKAAAANADVPPPPPPPVSEILPESDTKTKAKTKSKPKAKVVEQTEPVAGGGSTEPTEPTEVPAKEKKPTLPAKFAKFMQFGYFFVTSMKDAGLLDDTVSADLLERLCIFASVDEQKAYYEAWLASAKESNKALRKTVAAQRKASLPPKDRKPRAKKVLDPNAPTKTRKPRTKKNQDNDLINELQILSSILGSSPTQETAVADKEETDSTQDSPEEDLDVREFVYNKKAYLIDDSTGNVFDAESHDHIGVFDAEKNVLTFV